jgi:nucleoside-diphosphate-sugar epimerase
MNKILITGHKGFIGRHVFADWQETHGYLVEGIDHLDGTDVGDFNGGDYELVIHLAAWADIRESMAKPEEYYENNVTKAKHLFNWCRDYNVRLLYASSSAVDDNYWENPYAMSKWINEQMAPPNSVGMRFTTVYGSNSRDNMMYGMLKDGTAPYVTNHKRDWIHVTDVCRAIRYLVSSTITGPVPIGCGESIPVKKLAEAFGHGDLPIKTDTPGEAEDNLADTSILRSIGWFPTINILDTVND